MDSHGGGIPFQITRINESRKNIKDENLTFFSSFVLNQINTTMSPECQVLWGMWRQKRSCPWFSVSSPSSLADQPPPNSVLFQIYNLLCQHLEGWEDKLSLERSGKDLWKKWNSIWLSKHYQGWNSEAGNSNSRKLWSPFKEENSTSDGRFWGMLKAEGGKTEKNSKIMNFWTHAEMLFHSIHKGA